MNLDSKKIIVSTMVLLALLASYGATGISSAASTGTAPVAVTDAYWYSANSTQLVSPGDGYVPLFVQFEVAGSFAYVNVSVNLTYYGNSPFSYSYISGPNVQQVDSYNITAPALGSSITINQLANISSSATQGVYEVALQVTTNTTPNTPSYVPFKVAVLGTPDLSVVNYYTNPPVLYQDQKFIEFTAVISNTGAGPAKNIMVSASSPSFDILISSYNITYFASGMVENFTFLMNALNVTGQAPLTLAYGSQTISVPLYLNNYGSLQISDKIPVLTPGAGSVLEQFNITNTGQSTMYNVNVYLLSPSVVSLHIPSTNPLAALTAGNFTIAKLTPGQTVVVTYIVDVSSSAALMTYPAQIVVQWNLNNTAQQFHQVYNFNEKVSPTAFQQLTYNFSFTPLNVGVLLLIIILIAGLAGMSARSRKLKKKLKAATGPKDTPSLIHRDLPEKNGEEKKN